MNLQAFQEKQIKENKLQVGRGVTVSQGLTESSTQAHLGSSTINLQKSENDDLSIPVNTNCEQVVKVVSADKVDNLTMPAPRETRSSLKPTEESTSDEMSQGKDAEISPAETEDIANNNSQSETTGSSTISKMDSPSIGHDKGQRKLVEVSATGLKKVKTKSKLRRSKGQTLNIELTPQKDKAQSDVSSPTVYVYPGAASKQLGSIDKRRKQLQQIKNRIVSPRLQMQRIQNMIKQEADEINSRTPGTSLTEKEKTSFSGKKGGKNNSEISAGKSAKKRDTSKKAVAKSPRKTFSPSVDKDYEVKAEQHQQADGSRNLFDTFSSMSPATETINEDGASADMETSDNGESIVCYHCELAFSTKERYESHLKFRHSKKLQKIKTLTKERQIIREMKRKSVKYSVKASTDKVKCTVCNKMLASKQTLKAHMNIHLGLKPHVCKECGHAFCDYGSLIRHVHMHKGVRSYTCKICSKSFAQRSGLSHHMNVHGSIRPYKCDQCNKTFTQKPHRDKHIRAIHTKVRTDVCDVCGKAFPDRWKLAVHMRTHTNEKPYACHICKNKRFADSSNYRLHMRYHSGERPFACPHCDKTFIQSIDLKRHLPFHGGERPYICKLCDYDTYIEQNMVRHVRTHFRNNPKKKFSCTKCDKSFSRSGTMKRHMQDMHEDAAVL